MDLVAFEARNRFRGPCLLCGAPVRSGGGYEARRGGVPGGLCSGCYQAWREDLREAFLQAWRAGEEMVWARDSLGVGQCQRCGVPAAGGWVSRWGPVALVVCGACRERGWSLRISAEAHEPDLGHVPMEVRERLFDFQRADIGTLQAHDAFLLASDMGSGKSAVSLVALPRGPGILAITPSSGQATYAAEAAKWRPDLAVSLVRSRKDFRWPMEGELCVARWDSLPQAAQAGEKAVRENLARLEQVRGLLDGLPDGPERDALLAEQAELTRYPEMVLRTIREREAALDLVGRPPAGTCIVFDEAHYAKSARAQRTRNARALSRLVAWAGGKRYLLTATPLLNRPPELWSVLRLGDLHEEAFGSWGAYETLWGGERIGRRVVWGEATPEVRECLARVMVRRLAEDVLDLPPMRRRKVVVDLDEEVVRRCDELLQWAGGEENLEEMLQAVADGRGGSTVFERLAKERAAVTAAKIPALLELVEAEEAAGRPVAVFSAHRAPVEILGARRGWGSILGGTKPEDRYEVARDFCDGGLRGVAYSLAGAEAISLTSARTLILASAAWNPATNEQAIRRVQRIGTREPVDLIWLVGRHPVEEIVLAVNLRKMAMLRGAGLEIVRDGS